MKRLNKKRIIILIILIIIVILELIAFKLSRAQNIKEIELIAIDNDGILQDETTIVNGIEEGDSRILY